MRQEFTYRKAPKAPRRPIDTREDTKVHPRIYKEVHYTPGSLAGDPMTRRQVKLIVVLVAIAAVLCLGAYLWRAGF